MIFLDKKHMWVSVIKKTGKIARYFTDQRLVKQIILRSVLYQFWYVEEVLR